MTTTQKPVEHKATVTYVPQEIQLPDGRTAKLFVPQDAREMAIVDLAVLQRLASMLPTAQFYTIKSEMVQRIRSTDNLEQYLSVLRNELAFHESVNMINLYSAPVPQPEQQIIEP